MRPAYRPNKRVPDGATKSVLVHVINEVGGVEQAAFICNVSGARVYQLRDEGTMTFDDIARLTMAGASTAAVEYLATLAGGQFVPVEPVEEPVADLIQKYAKESGDVMQACVAMLASGRDECGVAASEIDQAIRVLIAARRKCTPKDR
jgi:hypothetical protein